VSRWQRGNTRWECPSETVLMALARVVAVRGYALP
jgi:hypothetical protein